MHLPCWMLGGNVQRRKIVEVAFDVRAFGNGEPHLAEDRNHLVDGLADRMDAAGALGPLRQGDVDPVRREAGVQGLGLQHVLAGIDRVGDRVFQNVQLLAGIAAVLGRQLADTLDHLCDGAGLAQRRDAQVLQRRQIGVQAARGPGAVTVGAGPVAGARGAAWKGVELFFF